MCTIPCGLPLGVLMRKRWLLALTGLALFASTALAQSEAPSAAVIRVAGLRAAATVDRDQWDIAHIRADNEHDLFFLQGFVHAQDRLFQMDVTRRTASGTLAELLGSSSIISDVLFRQLGLRRAAERSLPVLSDRAQAALQAYADGVNAYVAANPLPAEYKSLELSTFQPWTSTDSMVVSKYISFSQSFDFLDLQLTVALVSYQLAGNVLGFDGSKLFMDVFRSAPFETAATIPDASVPSPSASTMLSVVPEVSKQEV